MNRILLFCCVTMAVSITAVAAGQGLVEPPIILLSDYRFIPSESTVDVTGGDADYNLKLNIIGEFGLERGYGGEPVPVGSAPQPPGQGAFAKFVNVNGILVNLLSATSAPSPGWDLDKTLNMSGWNGTFLTDDQDQLFFFGADGQGGAMRVEADLEGGWLHITGGSTDPVGSNPVLYQINALAHLLPFPDFNGDGEITAADIVAMQQALSSPQAFEAQNDLSSADFVALADVNGDGVVNNADLQALLNNLKSGAYADPVPEPPSFFMLALALALLWEVQRASFVASRRKATAAI